MNNNNFLTALEAAEYLRVHINTLYRWIEEGKLAGYRPGDKWLFKKEDLDSFIEASKTQKVG